MFNDSGTGRPALLKLADVSVLIELEGGKVAGFDLVCRVPTYTQKTCLSEQFATLGATSGVAVVAKECESFSLFR